MTVGLFAAIKLGDKGGIENVIDFLSKEYLEKNINVVLFLPYKNINRTASKAKVSILFPYMSLLAQNESGIINLFVSCYINLLIKFYKIDIIHIHSIFPYGVILGRVKSRLPVKICISFHGGDIQVVRELNYGIRLNEKMDHLIRSCINYFDLYFSPSINIKRILEELGVETKKIKIIYHGFRIKRSGNNFGKFSKKEIDKIKLLSVGRNHPVKGYLFALDALKLVLADNYIYKIVGRNTNVLKLYAAQLGLSNKVEFTEEVEHDDIIKIMYNSDVLLLPSFIEGFPLVKAEAFSCGLPIITTDVPGCIDLITNQYNGIITKRNINEFAKAIEIIVSDGMLRERMKSGAIETAKNLSWNQISDEYISSYEKLLTN